jgi:hypothetical protein
MPALLREVSFDVNFLLSNFLQYIQLTQFAIGGMLHPIQGR